MSVEIGSFVQSIDDVLGIGPLQKDEKESVPYKLHCETKAAYRNEIRTARIDLMDLYSLS